MTQAKDKRIEELEECQNCALWKRNDPPKEDDADDHEEYGRCHWEPPPMIQDLIDLVEGVSPAQMVGRYSSHESDVCDCFRAAPPPSKETEGSDAWRVIASRLEGLHAQMFGIASLGDADLALKAISDNGQLHEAVHDCLRAVPASLLSQTETPVEETGGGGVEDLWFTDSRLPVMAISGDDECPRTIRLYFRAPVSNADRDAVIAALNEQLNSPAQETGDVERVTDAVAMVFVNLTKSPREPGGHGNVFQNGTGAHARCVGPMRCPECRSEARKIAEAALSAMRPVSVDRERLAEIRARHDSVADMADDEWDNRIYTIADDAFSDRAFLLSALEGVNHDAD